MHKVSKKENEPQGDDAVMLLRRPRVFDNNERRTDTQTPRGVTIVVSWPTSLVIVEASAR
jgi:hypothetical protein